MPVSFSGLEAVDDAIDADWCDADRDGVGDAGGDKEVIMLSVAVATNCDLGPTPRPTRPGPTPPLPELSPPPELQLLVVKPPPSPL